MKMSSTITLSLMYILVLANSVTTEPADCPILRNIIPDCNCEPATSNPNYIVINCRNKDLTSVPTINGSYAGLIYEFTLAHNEIVNLPADAFQGLKIQQLDVTVNKLQTISDVAFRGLETNLTVLKLSGDSTSRPTASFTAISNLTNLQELFLQNFQTPSNNLEDGSYFQPFANLLKLTLDSWGLVSIGNDAFRGLTSLKELTLTKHESLVTYPSGAVNKMKSTIEKIEITETGITKLQFYSFSELQILKTLVLRSNKINDLEDECFYGLENKLIYLDLSRNSIPENNLSRIQVLGSLEHFLLQNNGLVSISPNSLFLSNKTKLKELDLAGNHVLNIPSNTFKDLNLLTKLELSQNQIATMADNSLSGLTSLEVLHLDSQRLSGASLTLPSLASLTSLTSLVLDHTSLSAQSWDKISEAQSLTTLKMRETGITAIPSLALRMMSNLAELDVSDNQIQFINQTTFVGPRNTLKKIFLSNNKIGSFDSCTFYSYSSALTLDLLQNPLNCDCSLHWLSVAVKAGKISFSTTFETCFYPASLNGTRFTSVEPSEFCSSPPASPSCEDYYSTTTTSAPTTTTLPSVVINVDSTSRTIDSITIIWTTDQPQYLTHITVAHTELPSGQPSISRNLTISLPQYTISKLKSDTTYQICVSGHRIDDKTPNTKCTTASTKKSPSDIQTTTPLDPETTDKMSNNTELGIIIGSVVGALILFGILVAIIYLMVIRKKKPKEKYLVQPHSATFTRAALPTEGYDSKRYRKKKEDKTDGNKNDVSVKVISDGKTGPNIGRASTGSYQYLQNNQPVNSHPGDGPPYVNDQAAKQAFTHYENDMNMRPLPQMPKDSVGYYNPSSLNSATDDKQPHTYSEINL